MARMCAWVDETCFVEGHGYRVSIVRENEPGHTPTGSWPYAGKPGQTMPYFFGRTSDGFNIEAAQEQVDAYNAKLGLSKHDAFKIVASSMFPKGKRRTKSPKARHADVDGPDPRLPQCQKNPACYRANGHKGGCRRE